MALVRTKSRSNVLTVASLARNLLVISSRVSFRYPFSGFILSSSDCVDLRANSVSVFTLVTPSQYNTYQQIINYITGIAHLPLNEVSRVAILSCKDSSVISLWCFISANSASNRLLKAPNASSWAHREVATSWALASASCCNSFSKCVLQALQYISSYYKAVHYICTA